MRKIYGLGLALFCLGVLNGCGQPPHSQLRSIKVVADAAANHNTATAIDFVFVYDPNAVALLPATGPNWFAHKASLETGLASSIDVVALQIPPATAVNVTLPKRSGHAIAVVAFANYDGVGGQPGGKLSPYRDVLMQLEPETIVYRER